jgi:hypothetical protein
MPDVMTAPVVVPVSTDTSTGDPETILYFCYGPQALYDQAIFSILSLMRIAWEDAGNWQIVVYCDRPTAFAALPVNVVAVDQPTLDAWLGDTDYIHRRKTCAIIDALNRYGGKIVFVDTDTYWTRSPRAVFERVAPDATCFHLLEGYLLSSGTPFDQALSSQLSSHVYRLASGAPVTVDALTPMWNTGVVGVHEASIDKIYEALSLSEQIWADADPAGAYGKKIHHAEQFAMGFLFRDYRLHEAADCVHHYWPQVDKMAFAAILPELNASGLADASRDNLERIFRARHRRAGPTAWIDRAKMTIRKIAQAASLPVKGVRHSV